MLRGTLDESCASILSRAYSKWVLWVVPWMGIVTDCVCDFNGQILGVAGRLSVLYRGLRIAFLFFADDVVL